MCVALETVLSVLHYRKHRVSMVGIHFFCLNDVNYVSIDIADRNIIADDDHLKPYALVHLDTFQICS